MNFTEEYKKRIEGKETVVQVTLPESGLECAFKQPTAYGHLFKLASFPQSASTQAVGSWIDKGLIEKANLTPETVDTVKLMLALRDRVLELSRTPKLVMGPATADNELSCEDLSDEDLNFLLTWVASGGRAGDELATFPGGRGQNAAASTNGGKVRRKAKRAARA